MTKTARFTAFFLACASSGVCANDGVPASSNVPGSEYPRIHSDARATFRLKAPSAAVVKLQPLNDGLGKGLIDMKRDEAGRWGATLSKVRPGFHYYAFVVDGVQVNDPGSQTYFGWGRETSGIEVPEKGIDFYECKDVPHGDVRIRWYRSSAFETSRRVYVYTPPGYDANRSKRYPVLYLQHGAGESERAWTEQGRANFMLDNLIAAGKAKPMIVVMENGYAGSIADKPDSASVRENFDKLISGELIWYIDSNFRTLADSNNRAIAGLSMGAGQAIYSGLKHADLFAWIGAMSGGTEFLEAIPADVQRMLAAKFQKRLWIGYGVGDAAFAAAKRVHETLEAKKVPHVWFETAGTHEWQVWRKCFLELAQQLFR